MTNEQIMKWAAEAGISDWFLGTEDFQSGLQAKRTEQLKKFAELVADDERNECAELCVSAGRFFRRVEDVSANQCASLIRSRGGDC